MQFCSLTVQRRLIPRSERVGKESGGRWPTHRSRIGRRSSNRAVPCSSRFHHRDERVFAPAAQISDGLVVDRPSNPVPGISSNWHHSRHLRQFNKRIIANALIEADCSRKVSQGSPASQHSIRRALSPCVNPRNPIHLGSSQSALSTANAERDPAQQSRMTVDSRR